MKLITGSPITSTAARINSTDDVRVKIGLRNNRLLYLRERKHLSQKKLGKLCGISFGKINAIECLRESPFRMFKFEGQETLVFSNAAIKLAKFFEVEPAFIFPESLTKIKVRDIEFSTVADNLPDGFYLDAPETPMLPNEMLERKQLSERIEHVFLSLSPREEAVLRMRFFEEMDLKEIGEKFGIHKETVRQIEAKALRKLRHPSKARKLRGFVDPDFIEMVEEIE